MKEVVKINKTGKRRTARFMREKSKAKSPPLKYNRKEINISHVTKINVVH